MYIFYIYTQISFSIIYFICYITLSSYTYHISIINVLKIESSLILIVYGTYFILIIKYVYKIYN